MKVGFTIKEFRSQPPTFLVAHFLFDLGLRRYPPLQELIQLCTNANVEVGGRLRYHTNRVTKIY